MSHAQSESSPKLAGMKYLVEEVLSSGDSATVMRIADGRGLGRKYVLKVLKREGPEDEIAIVLARMTYEASAKLGHPALLRYHDFRTRKSWFRVTRAELLMDYVEGKSLDKLDGLKISPWVLIFGRVAEALSHMHRRGVRHGDLTPARVILARSGEVKIIDFGHATIRREDGLHAPGTRDYMAPEQIKEKIIDEKTDLYAFGATMYRVLTGQPANLGTRSLGEAGKIPIPMTLNPSIPAKLNNLIVACLQSHPGRRPEGFYNVKLALDEIATDLSADPATLKGLALKQDAD